MAVENLRGGTRAEANWAEHIRAAPVGVALLGTLLFFVGAGMVLGGAYMGIARSDTGWVPWVGALLVGPVVLYLALHVVRLTHWAWLTVVAMLVLLLGSSVLRTLRAPDAPVAPAGELVVELAALAYLSRRPIRRAFGWP